MNRTNLENWICNIEALPELNRQGLETLQLRRLNETLARVRKRGGFYRNYPEKLDSLEELQALPFTTAADLAAQPGQFLLTSQAEVSRVISGATSGTTGLSKRVFYTESDTEKTVGFFAAGISEMLFPGEKCYIAFPFTGAFGLGDLIAKAVEQLGGIPVKAGFGQTYGEMLDLISETRPETYIGFPVPLLSLFRMYGDGFPIKRALVSADSCPEGVMAALEKALGSKLYPHYGSRECGLGGAVTCTAFEGMHLRENHMIPEIIDPNGHVLPDGETGELVITTIGAEAMPLIRYRTGDFTRILPPCPCGGITRRIDSVSRGNPELSMEALDSTLFSLPDLVDFRASLHTTLQLECLSRDPETADVIRTAVQKRYPHLTVQVSVAPIARSHRPLYPGKRWILP